MATNQKVGSSNLSGRAMISIGVFWTRLTLELPGISQSADCWDHLLMSLSAKTRHVPQADLLQAMKDSLRDLENLKLLSPADLEIVDLRRSLKERIAALERQPHEKTSDSPGTGTQL
jgi:hypothetical protein